MSNAFYQILQKFGQEAGMPHFVPLGTISFGVIIITALLSCFFGFKLVRLWCAVFTFFIVAIVVCHLLKSSVHMGIVVTTFAIVGLIASFLVYQWFSLSVFILSVLIAYSITAVFFTSTWICFGVAIGVGLLSLHFSAAFIILSTAVWGGITLGFEGLSYLGIVEPTGKVIFAAGLAVLGLVIQYSMNKTYLTQVTDFIERLTYLAYVKRSNPYIAAAEELPHIEEGQTAGENKVFRKELKYPMSILDFYRLRKHLECFVRPDPHSDWNGYRVRSLYFDSDNDQDLNDCLAGQMEKRKIRLRFYPPDTGFIRLEYKCKSGNDCIKQSIRLPKEAAQSIMKGDYSPLTNLQDPLAMELYGRLMLGGYRPKAIVDYRRLAYTYPVSNTRVNFDSEVSASYVTESFFDENPGLIPVMDPDMGILEVKYDHFLVGILKEVLEPVDLLTKANSKYVQSRFLF